MDRQKILVVDDENRMRKLVKDFLQRENFEVLEAGDGSEALDVFFAHQVLFQSADYHADGEKR